MCMTFGYNPQINCVTVSTVELSLFLGSTTTEANGMNL